LAPLYQSLDLLVFNTDWDAFPTTPLEAMSHAVPVVASSAHGGPVERISDPQFGVLLTTHDEAALAAGAIALLRDPAAARRLGEAGRDRVADLCTLETTVTAYERLLAGGSITAPN